MDTARISEAQAERFEQAKQKIIGQKREKNGIGTLGEKTVHAVLKHYYAPDEAMHEIRLDGYVADIFTGSEVIEIQSRHFHTMRGKLAGFLPQCPVTVVYPIPAVKWLVWIDEETGEYTPRRKSPAKGNPYLAFPELYRIKQLLKEENLRFELVFMDMEEYRLLNGWSADKKKGSCRFDRLPLKLVDIVTIERPEDYMQFIPPQLEGDFTSARFAKAAHIKRKLAQTVLNILFEVGCVRRVGKSGNNYLYQVQEK